VSGYLQVSTTTATHEDATKLARSAVKAGLAASAQVHGPLTSIFWHLGEFGEGDEWQVTLRTTTTRYGELEAHLLTEHPWDNPEVTATEISHGSSSYLAWLDRSTNP
jgi:periplasmic divalent cation tolerance protein